MPNKCFFKKLFFYVIIVLLIHIALPYDPVNAAHLYLWLYITFALNCFIQFSILSFIWRLMSRRNYS